MTNHWIPAFACLCVARRQAGMTETYTRSSFLRRWEPRAITRTYLEVTLKLDKAFTCLYFSKYTASPFPFHSRRDLCSDKFQVSSFISSVSSFISPVSSSLALSPYNPASYHCKDGLPFHKSAYKRRIMTF